MRQNQNLLLFLILLLTFLSLNLVSLGALIKNDGLVLGLWFVKVIDVGCHMDLIF